MEKFSKEIWIMKAFAIFSVVSAHVNILNYDSLGGGIITYWYYLFGLIGVIIFFILGGYLFNGIEQQNKLFWKNKIKKIIIPWIIAGTITYFLHVLKVQNISLYNYFKWIIGSGTIYYYLTNYVLFLLIFRHYGNSNIFLIVCIIMTLLQSILNTFEIYNTFWFITKYLNIFNWIGFFALGIIIKKYDILTWLSKSKKLIIVFSLISVSMFIFMFNYKISEYFNIFSLIYEVINFVLIFLIVLKIKKCCLLEFIGKISFCIYLYHIQIVQKICWNLLKALPKPTNLIFLAFNPIIGLLSMTFLIWIFLKIISRFKYKKVICNLIGVR